MHFDVKATSAKVPATTEASGSIRQFNTHCFTCIPQTNSNTQATITYVAVAGSGLKSTTDKSGVVISTKTRGNYNAESWRSLKVSLIFYVLEIAQLRL